VVHWEPSHKFTPYPYQGHAISVRGRKQAGQPPSTRHSARHEWALLDFGSGANDMLARLPPVAQRCQCASLSRAKALPIGDRSHCQPWTGSIPYLGLSFAGMDLLRCIGVNMGLLRREKGHLVNYEVQLWPGPYYRFRAFDTASDSPNDGLWNGGISGHSSLCRLSPMAVAAYAPQASADCGGPLAEVQRTATLHCGNACK
jgi:hypothetical protein